MKKLILIMSLIINFNLFSYNKHIWYPKDGRNCNELCKKWYELSKARCSKWIHGDCHIGQCQCALSNPGRAAVWTNWIDTYGGVFSRPEECNKYCLDRISGTDEITPSGKELCHCMFRED